jgi:hypothetical protein
VIPGCVYSPDSATITTAVATERGLDRVLNRERREPARPTDSPAYRRLKNEISDREYERLVNEERRRHGLPEIQRQAAEGDGGGR